MRHILIKKTGLMAGAMTLSLLAASCGMIYDDDLRPCRNDVKIRFVYDLNMGFRDAFGEKVNSVEVWAFDRDGSPAWHGSQEGASLAETGFGLQAGLPPGEYEFVSWCGLSGNDGYELATYTPRSKEELIARLATAGGEEASACSSRLPDIFNGHLGLTTVSAATDKDIEQEIIISLTEDSKRISVTLEGPTVADSGDYSVAVTAENRQLGWDNVPSGGVVYRPWKQLEVESRVGSAVSYRIDTSRLMAGSEARLVVVDKSDGSRVVDIPLVEYLLKIKGNYQTAMGDQEFLDRENNYELQFTLNDKGEFDINSVIYINGWAIVPTQIVNPQ